MDEKTLGSQLMTTPPTFTSPQQFLPRLEDTEFWSPYVAQILERHGLPDADGEPAAGFNGTYPTFIVGEVVVKLFGHFQTWREGHAAERAAYALLASDPEIAAPHLLGEGRLCDDIETPWPYLITTRMPGVALWRAELPAEQKLALAAELGRQIRRVHALPASGLAIDADWRTLDAIVGARQSSLPPHLITQVDDFLARLGPFDRVVVNGDVIANHVYVDNGRLTGIIDWGDTMVTDRHYELIQPYRDVFCCDKSLFRAFLEASDWPVGKDFPRRALGLALYRQAVGAARHHTMDVFEPIAALLPLKDIGTLDELAIELFAV